MAFLLLKSKLASTEVLAHYDPSMPVKLDCDASAYSVGAVLSHKYPYGSECPIAYASRTINSVEANYVQIEKEGLALIFGVKKFHKYLYGTLVTDHKPLLAILGSIKICQHWLLQDYSGGLSFCLVQYDLEFRPTGQHCNADDFSRLPRMSQAGEEEELEFAATACNSLQLEMLPPSTKDLQQATAKDSVLGLVLRHTREGWPQEVPKSYFQRRQEISVDLGCLFLGSRVIIPTRYQERYWVNYMLAIREL